MHSKFLSMLALASLAVGCSDGASKDTTKAMSSAHASDAGAATDAGKKGAPDAGHAASQCKDDKATPGNQCDDAVGCRAAPGCALASQSCCVPGFDVANVKCIDGLTCGDMGGRATCDGPEDCGGKACCVDIGTGTTDCLDSCEGKIGLCHTDDDCASGQTCNQGKSFTWWGICG